jgi:hypothetical protein
VKTATSEKLSELIVREQTRFENQVELLVGCLVVGPLVFLDFL